MKTRLKLAQVMFVRLIYHLVHSDNLSTNAWISPKEMYLIVDHEGMQRQGERFEVNQTSHYNRIPTIEQFRFLSYSC